MNELFSDQPFDVRAFVAVEKTPLRIAAVLYDVVNGTELAYFDQLVGESDEKNFPEVLEELKKFCDYYPIWTFNKEEEILERYCTAFSLPFPFRTPFIRVKSLLRSWGINPADYSSRTLYMVAGLTMDSREQDALHDARSMAAAVSYFENRVV
jgi:hypothetical protein